jgi:hypothetical protein
MKRRIHSWAVVIASFAIVGCGSSDGKKPTSMSDVAAAHDAQQGAANGAAPASVDGAAPAAANMSLASKRGFDLQDWSNEAAYVLVKADAAKTAEALARVYKAEVAKDVLGKSVDEDKFYTVVYQISGHPWSVFACSAEQLETLWPELSKEFDVLTFWNSDFSAWASVDLWRGGKEVEALRWGPAGDEIGELADASKWHATAKTEDTDYLFRSTLRKVTPDDLKKGDAFVSELFAKYDAYLPDADQMPWLDEGKVTCPVNNFSAVHAIYAAEAATQ